ncbi:MAG TPA: hypothetical protein PK280_20895, partial [Planctomycetota bacterium]|nr:hypothetical protein [Planctomycetota bacterium]
MAKCGYCGSTILFGGVEERGHHFCNNQCLSSGYAAVASEQVPPEVVESFAKEIHEGTCPICKGRGPVDVHVSHRVWSILVMTSWSSHPQICCRSCGLKRQLGNTALSLVFGWWGFPWGLVMTPIQVGRNVFGMAF